MLAIGLMSGTSADGIDAALIETDGVSIQNLGRGLYQPYPSSFRQEIISAYGLKPSSATDELEAKLTQHHGEAVNALLRQESLTHQDIDIIGFHGQTVLHCPPKNNQHGSTFQLGDGQRLADETGIPVVCQLRQNDMHNGGQGAPLVPIFHKALTHTHQKPVCVVNIGGVSNITWIGRGEQDLLAMDTGPGNALIDDWVQRNTSLPFDKNGELAASGTPHKELLDHWLTHPYFSQCPPKSLDRDVFQTWCFENEDFLNLRLQDQLATLTEFTAMSLLHCQAFFPQQPEEWVVCGGGAANHTLMKSLQEKVAPFLITAASHHGWNGDLLEAHAFGFLAVRSLTGLPLTFPATTGVHKPTSGGVTYKPLGSRTSHMA